MSVLNCLKKLDKAFSEAEQSAIRDRYLKLLADGLSESEASNQLVDDLLAEAKREQTKARAAAGTSAVAEQVPAKSRRKKAAPDTSTQADLFTESAIAAGPEAAKLQFAADFAIRVESEVTRTVQVSTDTIKTADDAAAVFLPFRDRAQETFLVALLDKNGKVLEVAQHSIGKTAEASVEVMPVLGVAAKNPDVARVWIAHNHPSGNMTPSNADRNITSILASRLTDIGVIYDGHVILGNPGYTLLDRDGDTVFFGKSYPAEGKSATVPITERAIVHRGSFPHIVTSPAAAKSIARHYDNDGVLLLSNQHEVVGFLAITPDEMKSLRANDHAGARRVAAAVETANSPASIIVTKRGADVDAADNLGHMLSRLDNRVLDHLAIDINYSAAERGLDGWSADKPFYSRPGQWYFSPLTRAVENLKQEVAPAAQWIATITKQAGVKADELEATGLTDWLALQAGKVTKTQILDFLNQNGVQVQEVLKGTKFDKLEGVAAVPFADLSKEDQRSVPGHEYADDDDWAFISPTGKIIGYTVPADEAATRGEALDALSDLLDENDAAIGDVPTGATKYGNYVVPGGENYRELLLTLPEVKNLPVNSGPSAATMLFQNDMMEKYGGATFPSVYNKLTGSEVDRYEMLVREDRNNAKTVSLLQDRRNNYKSGHWDEKNILAHVRFDERTDADGKRVLFINEIQSDWGQEGKKTGFAPKDPSAPTDDEVSEFFDLRDGANPADYRDEMVELLAGRRVPDGRPMPRAPFVTKTDAWVSLAIKRMIRHAAENGFDRVAFINGQQAADLYDLGKQVDRIAIGKFSGGYQVVGRKNGEVVVDKVATDESGLEALVGKDIATKHIETGQSTFEGADLQVGGVGMKAFYDKIVPKVAGDVIKKLGGGKLGGFNTGESTAAEIGGFLDSLGVKTDDGAKTEGANIAFDITPAMRDAALAGLPLFSFAGPVSVAANMNALDTAKKLLSKGQSAETVRRATGWFKGVDGTWRYEIADDEASFNESDAQEALAAVADADALRKEITVKSDGKTFKATFREGSIDHRAVWGHTVEDAINNVVRFLQNNATRDYFTVASLKPGDKHPLADVLTHPKLFNAYPDLLDMQVTFTAPGDYRGAYYAGSAERIEIALGGDRAQMLSTLLHEIQHAIQQREGFARGGNIDGDFTDGVKRALDQLQLATKGRVESWYVHNNNIVEEAERAAGTARLGLMYESAQRLLDYSRSDSPSGVLRHIRNEVQWLYSPEFHKNREASDVSRRFYDIPKRHNMQKRNAHLRDLAFDAAQVILAEIPAGVKEQFEKDPRTMKSLLRALQREAERAREPLAAVRALEAEARSAGTVADAHRFAGAYDIYRSLAGEVEARNTQARQQMTEEQRRDTPPSVTLDVPQDTIVVMMGGMDIQAPQRMANLTAPTAMPMSDVKALVTAVRDARGWPAGATVETVVSWQNLPHHLRDQVQRDGATNLGGIFDPMTHAIYLVQQNLYSTDQALFTLLHESGHAGLHALLGDRRVPLMRSLYDENADLRGKAERLQQAFGYSVERATEEALADMTGTDDWKQLKGWRKLVAAVRSALRDIATRLGLPAPKWSDDDVLQLLARASRNLRDTSVRQRADSEAVGAYSRPSDDPFAYVAAIWKGLSAEDNLYVMPKSISETLAGVFADIDPSIRVETQVIPPKGARFVSSKPVDTVFTVLLPRRLPDGTATHDKALVYQGGKEVWINVASLKEGTSVGTRLYAAVGNYAYNTGRVFIGDPEGLSDLALLRRTENMMSLAVKFGTTRFLHPHGKQLAPATDSQSKLKGKVKPLDWRVGEDDHNLTELARVSYNNVSRFLPEIQNVELDPVTGRFVDVASGQPITDAQWAKLDRKYRDALRDAGLPVDGEHDGGGTAVGTSHAPLRPRYSATLKRAAFANSLVRRTSPEGRRGFLVFLSAKVAGALEGEPGGVKNTDLNRVFYSRPVRPGQQPLPILAPGALPPPPPPVRGAKQLLRDAVTFKRDAIGDLQWKLGEHAYEKLAAATRDLLGNQLVDVAGHGAALADVMPPAMKTLMREYRRDFNLAQAHAANIGKQGLPLGKDERALLSDILEKELAHGVTPPAELERIATSMRAALSTQTDALLELDMLSTDSADRWRETYLPRLYNRASNNPVVKEAWKAAGRMKVKGDHLKGRGVFKEVPSPERADYEALGWEVRGQGRHGPIMWRDYTRNERIKMGENRDALERFVRGYLGTQRDIAVGRLFAGVASNPELSSTVAIPDWPRVPTEEVSASGGVKKYGRLAGMYVHPEVWEELQYHFKDRSTVETLYRKALSTWKEGKTALNPVAHTNNVVSNVVMVTAAGANGLDVARGVASYVKKDAYYREALDNGLLGTEFYGAEIQAILGEDLAVSDLRPMNFAARWLLTGASKFWSNPVFNKLRDAYDMEDQLFKMVLYRRARQLGLDIPQSMEYASTFIFDYSDMPAGVRKVRDYALPFIGYTYKAVPALTRVALTRPHRMAAIVGAGYALNALAYLELGDEGDEEEERKYMPEWAKGMSLWGLPKLWRLPFNTDGEANYLDVYRWFPAGDFVDLGDDSAGADLPSWITPGGPFWDYYNVVVLNKDAFAGRDFYLKTDTPSQKTAKTLHWQASMWVPMYYHGKKQLDGLRNEVVGGSIMGQALDTMGFTGMDRRGDPVKLTEALLGGVGIKVRSFDPEEERIKRLQGVGADVRAEKKAMRKDMRDRSLSADRKEELRVERMEKVQQLREKASGLQRQEGELDAEENEGL